MRYFFNGFFAGLISGGTCFVISVYPTIEIEDEHEISRQTGYLAGAVIGIISLGAVVLYIWNW